MPGTGAGPPFWARPGPRPLVVRISGPIAPAYVRGRCEAVRSLLETSRATYVACDLGALADPDLSTVDALARLTLVARRLGLGVRVRDAPRELLPLLEALGLADVVPCGAAGRSAVACVAGDGGRLAVNAAPPPRRVSVPSTACRRRTGSG